MKFDFRLFLLAASMPVALGSTGSAIAQGGAAATGLVQAVRQAAGRYADTSAAMDDGYAPILGCVSAPEEGAMGLHFANEAFLVDGALNASQPELLVYEPTPNGTLHLVAVEFIVDAETWDGANEGPPVLEGQLFHFTDTPNRYGLPAFYSLHVWAFEQNPFGMFVDWSPNVTCEHFEPPE